MRSRTLPADCVDAAVLISRDVLAACVPSFSWTIRGCRGGEGKRQEANPESHGDNHARACAVVETEVSGVWRQTGIAVRPPADGHPSR